MYSPHRAHFMVEGPGRPPAGSDDEPPPPVGDAAAPGDDGGGVAREGGAALDASQSDGVFLVNEVGQRIPRGRNKQGSHQRAVRRTAKGRKGQGACALQGRAGEMSWDLSHHRGLRTQTVYHYATRSKADFLAKLRRGGGAGAVRGAFAAPCLVACRQDRMGMPAQVGLYRWAPSQASRCVPPRAVAGVTRPPHYLRRLDKQCTETCRGAIDTFMRTCQGERAS